MPESLSPVIDVGPHNLDETGFFCYMSKRKFVGYKKKHNWMIDRFAEGLRLRMLKLPNRGFIEYLPAEFAWRPIEADGYLFIHCLWIVGKSKGKGFARQLLEDCITDARTNGNRGVAMVTSEKVWLVDKSFLIHSGFEVADSAEGVFNLMALPFDDGPLPRFVPGIGQRAETYGKGLTVFRAEQCPYIEDATNVVREVAENRGIPFRAVEMTSSAEIRERAVSAFGIFGIVYRGELLSYHYLTEKQLNARLDSFEQGPG